MFSNISNINNLPSQDMTNRYSFTLFSNPNNTRIKPIESWSFSIPNKEQTYESSSEKYIFRLDNDSAKYFNLSTLCSDKFIFGFGLDSTKSVNFFKKSKVIPENKITEYNIIMNKIRLQSDSMRIMNESFSEKVSEKHCGKFTPL